VDRAAALLRSVLSDRPRVGRRKPTDLRQQGGIHQVFESRNGEVALDKGDGYAIAANVTVSDLESKISKLLK
jgi:hypothetical protein